MKKNKIYLSLDDLNKLYGISPSILKAIKKKQKKRKNKKLKKNKIDNKNMNNHKSSSDHMVISSNLSTETQRLNVANVQKHIDDINKNNRLLVENNNINTNNTPQDESYNQYKDIFEGVKTGKLQVKQLPNGIQVKNKLLNKKPGPKAKSNRIEELDDIPFDIPKGKPYTFITQNTPVKNPLSNINSGLMNPNQNQNVIAVDFDDGNGNIPQSTSSDNFISENTELQRDLPIEEEKQFEQQETVNIPVDEPKANIKTVETPKQIDEQKSNIETVETIKPKLKTVDDYTSKELKAIAKKNKVKSTFSTKTDYFNFLTKNNFI
jgi:hypothetical protein